MIEKLPPSDDFDSGIFERLEATIDKGDPVVNEVVNRAREIEQIFNESINKDGGLNSTLYQMSMHELFSIWPYRNSIVKVSGQVFSRNAKGDLVYDVAREEKMISTGFMSIPVIDELTGDISAKICYALERRSPAGVERVGCHLDGAIIDYPYVSEQYSQQRLEMYCPGILADVDRRIGQRDGVDILEALRPLKIDIDELGKNYDFESLSSDLSRYISNKANFDQNMPYVFDHTGPLVMVQPSGQLEPHHTYSNKRYAGNVKGVLLAPSQTPDNINHTAETLIPYVRLEYFGSDKNIGAVNLLLPIYSINKMSSVRDNIYREE